VLLCIVSKYLLSSVGLFFIFSYIIIQQGSNLTKIWCSLLNSDVYCYAVYAQSGRGRGTRSSHSLGMHPLMASVGGYQQMAAARWYAGMGQQQQQLERRSTSL